MKAALHCFMKSIVLLTTLGATLNLLIFPATGQTPDTAAASPIADAPQTGWRIGKRDACSTEHLRTELVTNASTHEITAKTHRYVSVSSGENYLDPSGNWQPSQDLIELMPDGSAAAIRGPCKAYFAPNLNVSGALTFVSESNRVFRTHLLCLAYYSPVSGKRVIISQIRDCTAELLPPNQIVWRSAFSGADVRVTYTKGALETDVILTSRPADPEDFGFSSTDMVRLEVWHEYIAPPVPKLKARVLDSVTDQGMRATMAEPDLVDETLDFGDLMYPLGRVYSLDEYTRSRTNTVPAKIELANPALHPNHMLVAKRWFNGQDGTRTFLTESVPLATIQPLLSVLPRANQSATLLDPKRKLASRAFSPPQIGAVLRTSKPVRVATIRSYRPTGCCLDYIMVGWTGDYEFESGVTYFTSYVSFGGTVTFDPGCVIKGDSCYIYLYGALACNGGSLITSKDDDLFGEVLPEGDPTYNTHNPSGAPELWIANSGLSGLSGFRIRYASPAIQWDSGDWTLADTALELCGTGVYTGGTVDFENVTVCGVSSVCSGSYTGSYSDVCEGQFDNGMPNQWEIQYFGYIGVDPNGDPDGDGLNNFEEYVLGTNPTRPANPDTNNAINLQVYTPLY